MVQMPIIDTSKCNGCGLCVSICKCGLLVLIKKKVTVLKKEGCTGCTTWCTLCEEICPSAAISCPFEIIIEEKQTSV